MNKLRFFALVILLSFLSACSAILGEEVARLPINQVSTDENNMILKETTLTLKQGEEISFWSEMDMEYEGEVTLMFRVNIMKNGESMEALEFDPTDKNITINEFKSTVMDKTSWRFTGKHVDWTAGEESDYTFVGILAASQNPTLNIEKAEIIIRK